MGDSEILPNDYPIYPDGPTPATSWLPSGVGGGKTPNNQVDLVGDKVWIAWDISQLKMPNNTSFNKFEF